MAKKKRTRKKPEKTSGIRYDKATRKRAETLARSGKTVPEIAAKLDGPSQKCIREWLEAADIVPTSGRKRHFNREKILADLQATNGKGEPKFTRGQLCAKHGCSPKYLSNLANGKIAP